MKTTNRLFWLIWMAGILGAYVLRFVLPKIAG